MLLYVLDTVLLGHITNKRDDFSLNVLAMSVLDSLKLLLCASFVESAWPSS